jgi:hypothetical protein
VWIYCGAYPEDGKNKVRSRNARHALSLISGRRSRALSIAAAVCVLAGTALTRYSYSEEGKASAKHAADYLHYTREETSD